MVQLNIRGIQGLYGSLSFFGIRSDVTSKWKSFHEDDTQCLAKCRQWQGSIWISRWSNRPWNAQMGNCKVKGLGIKLLVAWTEEGSKENSSTDSGFFSLTAQSLNDGLKPFLRPLLPFDLVLISLAHCVDP